jgi:hypothetical protein
MSLVAVAAGTPLIEVEASLVDRVERWPSGLTR